MVIRKKINSRIRKSGLTLTGLVIGILIAMSIYIGGYFYASETLGDYNIEMDQKYSDTQANLTASQTSLNENVQAIKDNLDSIKEAETTWQVAWNGLKGLGNSLLLPISFVTSGIETYGTIENSLDIIPTWVKTAAVIGITVVIVFLILALLKGEGKM